MSTVPFSKRNKLYVYSVALIVVEDIARHENNINYPADSAETARKHPEETGADFSRVKSMDSEFAEKNNKNKHNKP